MARRTLLQLAFLVGVWWVLVDGSLRLRTWMVGSAAIVVGLVVHRLLGSDRSTGLRLSGLVGFLPYFAWQSLRAGWDVSRRALAPTLSLDPELLTYPLTLPSPASRVFFTNALSLLPGTLGADLRGEELVVHLLVGGPDARSRARELERRVASVFGGGVP